MQGIFRKENTDKALKYGIYRHLPTYEKIIRNLVSFLFKNIVVVQRKDTYYNADREKELGSILMKEAILTAKIKHKKV